MSEEAEYRIYVSSKGDVPVVRDIEGDEQLEQRINEVRNCYPDDTIVVREVLETVKAVITPINNRKGRRKDEPSKQ